MRGRTTHRKTTFMHSAQFIEHLLCTGIAPGIGDRKEARQAFPIFGGDFPRRGSFPDVTSELRSSTEHRAGAGKATAHARGKKMSEVCRGKSHVASGTQIQSIEMGQERSTERTGGRASHEAASCGIRNGLEGGSTLGEGSPDRDSPTGP